MAWDKKHRVAVYSMVQRRCAQEDISVGGECCGGVSESFGENSALFCKGIYVGSSHELFAVAAQPVRSQCVDGDEKDIVLAFFYGRSFTWIPDRSGSCQHEENEEKNRIVA